MGFSLMVWYLALGDKVEESYLLEHMNQIEEVVESMDSGLVSLHVKGTLWDKSFVMFAIPKNWFVLGETVSPQSLRLEMPEHQG